MINIARKQNIKKKVAVILGDPTLPDPTKKDGKFNPEDIDVVNRLKDELDKLKGYQFTYLDKHVILFEELRSLRNKVDYAFNLCDEGLDNDPHKEKYIPLILEELGIPYTGADAKCMRLCYNKKNVRQIAKKLGIPIPRGYTQGNLFDYLINIFSNRQAIDFPVIVKPVFGDGGFGITSESKAKTEDEIKLAIESLKEQFSYKGPILIEEFLQGNEVTQGIIGNPENYTVLPLIQEDYSRLPERLPKICGHEAKFIPNSPYWENIKSIPAKLEESVRQEIEAHSKRLFEHLKCRDYARFDWRLDSHGQPNLLEINPNPGWCDDGHLAKATNIAGISYSRMLEMILQTAEARFGIYE